MFFLPHILLFRKYVEYFSLILSFFNLKHSKTIDFSNDFSFDFDPNFDPNFSTLKRFETVQNSIFSLHQTAKNPGNQGFPGFFKYGPEGNRTPVRKPIHSGISHYSHSFDIPSVWRRMTGFRLQ